LCNRPAGSSQPCIGASQDIDLPSRRLDACSQGDIGLWNRVRKSRCSSSQRLKIGARSWVVQVDGIHSQGDELWIQLTRIGFEDRGLVLHVTAGVEIEEALKLLAERQAEPQPGEMIEVVPPLAS